MPKYLNPYTDFGFKKLFGEEANKDLLIDFLNQLLPAHHQIQELNFRDSENLPEMPEQRKAFFDIYCKSLTGEHFIVEMQKAPMKYFKDRSLFYVTYPIKDQAKKGDWNFRLAPIYFIAILDFEHEESEERFRKFRRDVNLKDQDGDVFYDKLQFKFLQMPLFHKKEHELQTHFDKWCYFLKNLESFEEIPAILNEEVFQKAFQTTALSGLSPLQKEMYEKSLLQKQELKNVVDTAVEKAVEKTAKTTAIEIAKNMLSDNEEIEKIAKYTKLSIEQIKEIAKQIKS